MDSIPKLPVHPYRQASMQIHHNLTLPLKKTKFILFNVRLAICVLQVVVQQKYIPLLVTLLRLKQEDQLNQSMN